MNLFHAFPTVAVPLSDDNEEQYAMLKVRCPNDTNTSTGPLQETITSYAGCLDETRPLSFTISQPNY